MESCSVVVVVVVIVVMCVCVFFLETLSSAYGFQLSASNPHPTLERATKNKKTKNPNQNTCLPEKAPERKKG